MQKNLLLDSKAHTPVLFLEFYHVYITTSRYMYKKSKQDKTICTLCKKGKQTKPVYFIQVVVVSECCLIYITQLIPTNYLPVISIHYKPNMHTCHTVRLISDHILT